MNNNKEPNNLPRKPAHDQKPIQRQPFSKREDSYSPTSNPGGPPRGSGGVPPKPR